MTPENQARRQRQQRWLYFTSAALAAAFLTLIAAVIQLSAQTERVSQETARQFELGLRLRDLQSILLGLGDAETGQRGFLLTGKP